MNDGKPNDRLAAQKITAGEKAAGLFAVEPGAGGWKLTRRSLLSGVLAVLAAQRAAAQVCTGTFAHTDSVTDAVLTPDGSTMITGSRDGTIKLWRVPPGAYYKTINAQAAVQVLAASATQLFSGSPADNDIRVWSFDGALQKKLSGHAAPVAALAVTPDGRLLLSASKSDDVRVWSLPSGAFLRAMVKLPLYNLDVSRQVAASPDNELALSSAKNDGIRIWQLPEGNYVSSAAGLMSDVVGLAVSPDGRLCAAGLSTGNIKLYSLPAGEERNTLVGHSGNVWSLAFTAESRTLISGGDDKTIRLWKVADGTSIQIQTAAHGDVINSLALTPDGQLISVGKDKCVKLWNMTGGGISPLMCLVDLAANDKSMTGRKYTLGGVEYTLPCGAAPPAGAVCTCNCVPGTGCSCVSQQPCSCNPYCANYPPCVCQLWGLYPDKPCPCVTT